MKNFIKATTSFLVVACLLASGVARGGEEVDYLRDIKPLLKSRCYSCHGGLKQEADLRLDTVALMLVGGGSGPAIAPGDPDESLLVQRVSTGDVLERMPPEFEAEPLSAHELDKLKAWIALGAPAPPHEEAEADPDQHWAFQQIVRPPVPRVSDDGWGHNAIDAFVSSQHTARSLVPQPPAPPLLMLRRLSLDLIGVPPTAAEIAEVAKDPNGDWYQRTVERLLADPRYGERWGRHWMDIWRYSDWWGLGDQLRNSQKHIWHWRDWIVESLNSDMPYDEMVRLMLAGDELYPNDLGKLRATGYLARNYFLFNRHQWMDETVEHVSKGFLGLTTNCAKCHDHKYDPISHTDYYALRAFFEPYHVRLDVMPGEPDLDRDGIARAFDAVADQPTYRFIRGEETNPDKSAAIAPGVPSKLQFAPLQIEPVELPLQAWQPERRPWVADAHRDAASKKIEIAEVRLAAASERLAAVQGDEAAVLAAPPGEAATVLSGADAQPPDAAPGAAPGAGAAQGAAEARLQFEVAQLELDLARAQAQSVESCAVAMQAHWRTIDAGQDDDASVLAQAAHQAALAAGHAQREQATAGARLALVEAELRLHRAAPDQQEAITKEVSAAREALEKAVQQMNQPSDQYTPFKGAQWTPTRFLNSTADDPPVAFAPHSTGRRLALAQWITDHRNPLTARVAANHIWTRHFGTPLVPSVFDFGRNGTPPTHPELLDFLASELMLSGWSMKHMHRLIVQSATYRLSSSSTAAEANVAIDPDNVHYWRRTPLRLESQAVRDCVLALAGTIDLTCGGPPVAPQEQTGSKRRSLYFFHSNNERNLFLRMFDEALVKDCYRREQSVVPQQALAMSNSELVLDAAPLIAERLMRDGVAAGHAADDDAAFIESAFAVVLGVKASEAEMLASQQAIQAWKQLGDAGQGESADKFARANLIWVLMNHNDFVALQ